LGVEFAKVMTVKQRYPGKHTITLDLAVVRVIQDAC